MTMLELCSGNDKLQRFKINVESLLHYVNTSVQFFNPACITVVKSARGICPFYAQTPRL